MRKTRAEDLRRLATFVVALAVVLVGLPRSPTTATRSSTVNSIRHLFALAEVSRLKYKIDVEVRYVAVPDDWVPPKPGVFDKDVMNTLADMGERMGADPASWQTEEPP